MKKMIVTLLARTPVHVGAGNSVGTVDAPVQRERHTGIPIIPGSSLKGVLSDLWEEKFQRTEDGKTLFGVNDDDKNAEAGRLLIGEGRLLAFPVRSAKGMFAWIVSPLTLQRFMRDASLSYEIPSLETEEEVYASKDLRLKNQVILEEYPFTVKGDVPESIVTALKELASGDSVWKELPSHLVIVSNEIFQHFCENACEVVTRIGIDNETGTVKKSGALFNMEQVPSETLFYSLVMAKTRDDLEKLKEKLTKEQFLQIGGHSTIGLGFCSVYCQEVK